MLESLKNNFDRLAQQWDCKLLEFNGEPDHVHLLLKMNPKVAPSVFVNNLKTVTSRLLRRDYKTELSKFYRKPIFWSRSYCILSCGGAPLSIIKQYIEQQDGVD
jgi:putative transposase